MKFYSFTKQLSVTIAIMMLSLWVFGQSQAPIDLTLRYLEQNKQELGLSNDDFADWVVNDQYKSEHNGVTHLYLIQRHSGIKIYNAMITSNITNDGKVLHLANRFVNDKSNKINTTSPSLTSLDAVKKVAEHIQVNLPSELTIKDYHNEQKVTYDNDQIALEPITTELVYQLMEDGSLKLAWNVYFYHLNGQNAWSIRVDATNGAILEQKDQVIKCNFSHPEHDDCSKYNNMHRPAIGQNYKNNKASTVKAEVTAQNFGTANAAPNTYTVVPPPFESPIHGAFDMVTTTGDAVASPQGWHSNGTSSWTFTRGNNVHAYQDRNGTNLTSNDEPDGGATLEFDFPFNQADEPDTYTDAATVNLFFWCNYVHDVFYKYGFNEASGNFQSNNFGNGGFAGDHVIAEAQDDALGASRNNANFSTPNDGSNGRMQMFLWDVSGADLPLFTINAPSSIAGPYATAAATFGPPITATPLTGDLVWVDDGVGVTTDACEPITNSGALTGKFAIIDRGDCEFGAKILNAEQQGAIAAVMCNHNVGEGVIGGMAPGAVGGQVTIPSIFLSYEDCQIIRTEMANNTVTVTFQNTASTGPNDYDGDFDNGIIGHEYGHGISNRLTGGPSASSCLGNDEQAGEGWSDLIALFLTVETGDMGSDPRGIGTYVERTTTAGGGIRRRPYSTDMTVNDQTYDDIRGTIAGAPHPVGEVMAATMWDLYWNLVDVYGFDADITNGSGGNNIAVQLYIDGLKMQACSPGFLDYRDAVLAADAANNGSANVCLIWETFARRGMGVNADQGANNSRNDGTEDYSTPEDCIEELKITKTATPSATTTDDIVYQIHVINDKGSTVTGVVVTDEIPMGSTYVPGSATMGGSVSGTTVTWNLGTLVDDEEVMFEFKVNPDDNNFTTIMFEDGFENGTNNWIASHDTDLANFDWFVDNANPASGTFSVYAEDPASEADQYFQTSSFYQLGGTRPAVIFDHYYDTERSFDGGLFEFLDANFDWNNLGDQMVRNGYPEDINNSIVATGSGGFSGNTGQYIETVVDLSQDYLNEEGFFRFRMISDDNTGGNGWYVDNFKLVDLYTISGEDVCITSTEGDNVCAQTPDIGTIIYGGGQTSSNYTINNPDFTAEVFPNPANDFISINLLGTVKGQVEISLVSVDGRLVERLLLDTYAGPVKMDVSKLSAGIYLTKIKNQEGIVTEKLVIN